MMRLWDCGILVEWREGGYRSITGLVNGGMGVIIFEDSLFHY